MLAHPLLLPCDEVTNKFEKIYKVVDPCGNFFNFKENLFDRLGEVLLIIPSNYLRV
jgi:hypothetical protein